MNIQLNGGMIIDLFNKDSNIEMSKYMQKVKMGLYLFNIKFYKLF